MKKIKLYHVLFSLALGAATVAAASYPALHSIRAARAQDLAEMQILDERLHQALVARDYEALQRLLSDDFELYTIRGDVLNKQEWIKNIQKSGMNYTNIHELGRRMKGSQLVSTSMISGSFWGMEGSWKIEATITSIDTKDRSNCQIKKLVVKDVS